jgi:hypothetical protein
MRWRSELARSERHSQYERKQDIVQQPQHGRQHEERQSQNARWRPRIIILPHHRRLEHFPEKRKPVSENATTKRL